MEFVCRFCEKSDFKRRGGLSRHLRKCALKYEAQLRREGKLNRRKWPGSAAGLSADQSEPFHELDALTASDSRQNRPSDDEPLSFSLHGYSPQRPLPTSSERSAKHLPPQALPVHLNSLINHTDGSPPEKRPPPNDNEEVVTYAATGNTHITLTLSDDVQKDEQEDLEKESCNIPHTVRSTVTSTEIKTFYEVESRRAGEPVPGRPGLEQMTPVVYATRARDGQYCTEQSGEEQSNESSEEDSCQSHQRKSNSTKHSRSHGLPDAAYWPFISATDYSLAHWFVETDCSQGDVDRFFQSKDLAPLQQFSSFRNAKQWLAQLEKIPYGIPGDNFRERAITVNLEPNQATDRKYYYYHRDIMKVIKLLIGHSGFADNLHYAPVQQWNSDGDGNKVRAYNNMHTAGWWWETQKKFPNGATLVPLIHSSDKTHLTQLHGDVKVWPVYLTIGNLDPEIRRDVKSPGTLLLGFLPHIPKKAIKRPKLEAEVYHKAMTRIFQRKFTLFDLLDLY